MLLRAALATLLFSSLSMGSTYYLATDGTGAQTQIDVNHTSSWVITPNTTFDLAGGLFTMKVGGSAVDDTVFKLFQGTDATGTLIDSVTLTNAQFLTFGGANCFCFREYFFPTLHTLTAGTTYFVSLTSVAPDVQSQAYFIKSDNFFASDINGVAVVPSPITPVPTPEPSTLLLSGLGLLALGLVGRKARRA